MDVQSVCSLVYSHILARSPIAPSDSWASLGIPIIVGLRASGSIGNHVGEGESFVKFIGRIHGVQSAKDRVAGGWLVPGSRPRSTSSFFRVLWNRTVVVGVVVTDAVRGER